MMYTFTLDGEGNVQCTELRHGTCVQQQNRDLGTHGHVLDIWDSSGFLEAARAVTCMYNGLVAWCVYDAYISFEGSCGEN